MSFCRHECRNKPHSSEGACTVAWNTILPPMPLGYKLQHYFLTLCTIFFPVIPTRYPWCCFHATALIDSTCPCTHTDVTSWSTNDSSRLMLRNMGIPMSCAQDHNKLASAPSCGRAYTGFHPGCYGHGGSRIISCFLLAHTPHGNTASIMLHHPNKTKQTRVRHR